MLRRLTGAALLFASIGCHAGESAQSADADASLRQAIAAAGVSALAPMPPGSAELNRLGQALFFDKILSGNRDIGCSTCHSPVYHTGDLQTLSIGTGGHGPAILRQLGTGSFTSRSAPELFDRADPRWQTLFWDGGLESRAGTLHAAAAAILPAGLDNPLAAQALLPLLDRVEMRGRSGENELGDLPDGADTLIWAGIVTRLMAVPGYDTLFAAAFPGLSRDSVTIVHVANAIAAFVGGTWTTGGTPFDQYLRGDAEALQPAARRGGLLFFGRGRCAACHNGPLLTDQAFHNVGVPPLGPGFDGGPDVGRFRLTARPPDRYAFRTPPLRNVALTPPYMHNGAYWSLDLTVRHFADVPAALVRYDSTSIDSRLSASVQRSSAARADLLATLDPALLVPVALSDAEIHDLGDFLRALTDARSLVLSRDVPARVPSGLPIVDR